MKKVILLNKKEGETPLEALELFRTKNKEYKNSKITYAGRLDPMASGLLILLVDEKIKEKEKYLKLDKEYYFEILFGFNTDSYDILGRVLNKKNVFLSKNDLKKKIKENLKYFTGEFVQKYPIYSSKTVKGKQLFVYARKNEEVILPSKKVNIKKLKFIKIKKIDNQKLLENIEKRIKKVGGDFRQKEILKTWQVKLNRKQMADSQVDNFWVASFNIKCSSGTYVRGIANSLGEKMDILALAFKIKRNKIGNFML